MSYLKVNAKHKIDSEENSLRHTTIWIDFLKKLVTENCFQLILFSLFQKMNVVFFTLAV